MRGGLLTEPIEIIHVREVDSPFGPEYIQETDIVTTRARVVHNGGGRSNQNGDIFYEYLKTLEVRMYVAINEYDQIKWRGDMYRVMSVEPNHEQQMKIIKIQLENK